jgi:hypothetical protein
VRPRCGSAQAEIEPGAALNGKPAGRRAKRKGGPYANGAAKRLEADHNGYGSRSRSGSPEVGQGGELTYIDAILDAEWSD